MHCNREILHVDDDPQITRLVAAQLAPYGYHVEPLGDSTRVIDELVHGKQRVVLLDIDMPDVNGLEVLHRIKEYDAGIQVIMLSGIVTLSDALQALRGGAEACFFKPVEEIEPLVEAIEGAFRKIDHWWEALRDLTRRKSERTQPVA